MRSNQKTTKITIQDRIIEMYIQILKDYLVMLSESKYINEYPNTTSIMYIGMNAIHRVFEYILIQTKNIEKVSYYSKKACYYYLEYMEQIYSSNLSQNLNQKDALLFVYKKTIFDLFNGESEDSYGTITNIMTLNHENLNIDEPVLRKMMSNILKTMNGLMYWDNNIYSFSERQEICNIYLDKIIRIVDNRMLSFLEAVQKQSLSYLDYSNLLKNTLEFYDKKRKFLPLDDNQLCDWKLDRFYIHSDEFNEKIKSGNMKELVEYALAQS
jgi:hypothetical protein